MLRAQFSKMPRYKAISYSPMTPRRGRRMKSAFLNNFQQLEYEVNENTRTASGSVSIHIPINPDINVAEDSDYICRRYFECSENAEGIIYSGNLFKDQMINWFAEHPSSDNIEKHKFSQYSRPLYCAKK